MYDQEQQAPLHPGRTLKKECLEPRSLSITDAAKALGVSRKTLSSIVNGRAGISPEMAMRLSIAFSTSAENWLNQQTKYDLWQVKQRCSELNVRSVDAPAAAEPAVNEPVSTPAPIAESADTSPDNTSESSF